MNDIELNECIAGIEQRWPGQLNDVLAGDLRAALRYYDKKIAVEAVRQVRLESNYRVIPVGKIINACKKRNPNASRPRSKKSVSWDIFTQNTTTGHFHQIHTGGHCARESVLLAAGNIRDRYGPGWVVVSGVTIRDMVRERSQKIVDRK